MLFKTVHMLGKEEIFTEETVPIWLTHKESKWFLDKHVLKLEVGKSIESDFHIITRLD